MSVRNAGKTIREARIKAGLTQEQLSEGVCSVLSLSRIENGSAGVSPVTFQALMAHAGAPCEVYPIFASRTDFDCFYTLNRARFYLGSWQLSQAYEELNKLEEWNFADNKLYYQEYLYLNGQIQVCSGCADHHALYDLFSSALHITRPEIDYSDFHHLLLLKSNCLLELHRNYFIWENAIFVITSVHKLLPILQTLKSIT